LKDARSGALTDNFVGRDSKKTGKGSARQKGSQGDGSIEMSTPAYMMTLRTKVNALDAASNMAAGHDTLAAMSRAGRARQAFG